MAMLPAEFNAHEFNTSLFNSNLISVPLTDSLAIAESIIKDVEKILSDSQFLQDNGVQKQVSKGFNETLRLSTWITKNRRPGQDSWSDQ